MIAALDVLSFALGRQSWRRFAATFILFYAQVVGTEFVLGAFSALYGYALAALNIVITAALFFVLHRKFGSKIFRAYLKSLKKALNITWKDIRKDPLFLVLVALSAVFIVWVVFLGFVFPVLDWDGNAYHLTFVGYLMQNHNFYDVPADVSWLAGYPKGGEFIQAWSVLIAHSDRIIDLTQLPFLFLGIYALCDIARSFEIDKRHARFAAFTFVFIPIIQNQLKTGYIDLILCSTFLAGLALVLKKKIGTLDLLLIALVFSELLAIKSSGIYFIVFLLPLLIWDLYKQYGKAVKNYLKPALLVLVPMSFGAYWYIKDWVLYKSPIYPFGIKLAGKTIFHGIDYRTWSVAPPDLPHTYFGRIWTVWAEGAPKDFGYNYDSNYTGLGPVWFILLLPAAFVSLVIAIRTKNKRYLAFSGLIWLLFAVYPTNFAPRYSMFVLATGIIGLAFSLGYLSKYTQVAVKYLAILLAFFVTGVNYTQNIYVPDAVNYQIGALLAGQTGRYTSAANIGPQYVYIENHTKAGQTVVYDTSVPFIYPLWNNDYSNRVVFIKQTPTAAEWYRKVYANHTTYILIFTGDSVFPPTQESVWAQAKFKNIVYKDATHEILKVN